MTSIQPELWVDRGAQAIAFYQAAFGAAVLHRVGDGEDIVAQGGPPFLQVAASVRWWDMYLAGPPVTLQRALFAALGPVARLRGYRSSYPASRPANSASAHQPAAAPQPGCTSTMMGRIGEAGQGFTIPAGQAPPNRQCVSWGG